MSLEQEAKELTVKLIVHLMQFDKVDEKKPETFIAFPEEFEKDDDSNYHIDYMYSLANCRAANYELVPMNWLTVKLKAGRIIPALATTTAAIAALQTIEVCKLIKGCDYEQMNNSFLNLAIPIFSQSEPGPVPKVKLREDLSVTIWDQWEVKI